EVVLEPAHALLRPLLDPRLREVVFDLVKDAAIHGQMIDLASDVHMSRSAHLRASGRPSYVAPMHAFLIVNPSSGNGGSDELLAAAGERGIETHVLREGDDLAALARGARADALAMAGGDG